MAVIEQTLAQQPSLPDDVKKAITNAFEELREKAWSNEDKLVKSRPDDNQPKSYFADPFALLDSVGMGYRNAPTYLTYDTLRQVAERDTFVSAIILTRIDQVCAFARPQPNKYSVGFKIQPRYGDKKRVLTESERERCDEIQGVIINTGREYNLGRDGFRQFLAKFVRDSMTFDQATFECTRTRGGSIYQFNATPSDTIRTATPKHMKGTPPRVSELRNDIKYIQVINSSITAEFTIDEMAFCVRNPRTNVKTYGYGLPEIETLMTTITSHLWAEEWNRNAFSQGSTIKGMLNIKGNIPPAQFEAFKRMWHSQVAGVSNAHKTPMINSEEIQWMPLQLSNTEMGYQMWVEYLCFVPGTRVMTPDGEVPIEDVQPGGLVFSHTGEPRRVVNTQKHHHRGKVINIAVGGETIRSTPEHPFLVSGWLPSVSIREFGEPVWVDAKDLEPGRHCMVMPKKTYEHAGCDLGIDVLHRIEHEDDRYFYVPIRETWAEDYDGPVHNLEVDVDNTYQVNRFATHNCKITTALFRIDPAEINFDLRGGVGQQPVFMSTNEAQQKASKDRGLQPLMHFVEDSLNRHVVWKIDPRFELAFVGLDAKTEEQAQQLRMQQVQNTHTLNEVRAMDDLPPVQYGDNVMNATYMGYKMQKEQMTAMAQQPPQGQMQPGQPGQEQPQPRFSEPHGEEEQHGAEQLRQFAEPKQQSGSSDSSSDEDSGPSPKTLSTLHRDDWSSIFEHSVKSDDLMKAELFDTIDLD